jgi:peroxiredoxin family protein
MFFTFWGLNILRRPDPKSVSKTIVERMFGWMMPKGARALKLSQLHMAGMGTAMMKGVMKHKNVDSLETMIRMARDNGVRMIACQMTMDLMGIKPEELIDGVELGGVATMLNEADKGNALLFV